MITGALTFFLPCGFTQAMQLFAISTGSFSRGALIMGIFALGTAPGLLSVGGLTSVVKGIFAKRFFKFAGVLVIFLAMFNIANGYNLTGWQIATDNKQQTTNNGNADPNVTLENGVQIVKMTESASGYSPKAFTIKKGVPVKWVITANDPYSCASSLVVSSLNVRKTLVAGENVIEFTPKESGRIPFSCAMGMYTGSFNVTDGDGTGAAISDNSTTQQAAGSTCGGAGAPTGAAGVAAGSCGGSGGGCGAGAAGATGGGCGGSGKPVVPVQGSTTTQPVQASTAANTQAPQAEQVISATYTYATDIQPNSFKVKVDQPVRIVVDVKEDGVGCMSTIMIPGLSNTPQLLQKGSKLEMAFTPTKKGSYQITCAMGVPRGTLIVE